MLNGYPVVDYHGDPIDADPSTNVFRLCVPKGEHDDDLLSIAILIDRFLMLPNANQAIGIVVANIGKFESVQDIINEFGTVIPGKMESLSSSILNILRGGPKTIKAASKLVGISPEHFYNWYHSVGKKIPGLVKVGIATYEYHPMDPLKLSKTSFPSLLGLHLVENTETFQKIGEITSLFELPSLEELHIRGIQIAVSPSSNLRLRSLTIETERLSNETLKGILNSDLPSLEELDITLKSSGISINEIRPLWLDNRFSKLRRLTIRNCDFSSDLLSEIANTEFRKLDISVNG